MKEGRQEVKDQTCLALSQKPRAIIIQINLCRLDGVVQEVKEVTSKLAVIVSTLNMSDALEAVMKNTAQNMQQDAAAAGFGTISSTEIAEAKRYVERYGMSQLNNYFQSKLDVWKETPVALAITGQSGSGKSSFINKVMGKKRGDTGAAATGVNETTLEPKAYHHPENENIVFWDLPGIGTRNFQKDDYLDKVNFKRYDCFLILSENRFTENDLFLAKQILDNGKRFYFVRTKVDNAIRDEAHDMDMEENEIDEDFLLGKIRNYIVENLEEIEKNKKLSEAYLITTRNNQKFDFPVLMKHVLKELPDIKREVMIRALTVTSKDIVEEKKRIIKDSLWKYCAMSGGLAMIPFPGLSVGVDTGILYKMATDQRNTFGLTEESLELKARQIGMTLEALKKDLPESDVQLLKDPVQWLKTLATAASVLVIESAAEETVKWAVPILGSLVSGGLSFGTTYWMGAKMLDEHAKMALSILEYMAKHN